MTKGNDGGMSKGTAVVAILVAFVGGLAIGNLTARGQNGGGEEVADAGEGGSEAGSGGAGAGEAGGPERLRVPVTAAQPVKGPADALVTIVEFSDFECPFCSRVGPTLNQIMTEYAGRVRIVWRNNPLPFHQNATPAAEAAMEAMAQGGSQKFFAYHDLLFANQQAIARADLERYAQQLNLDMNRFRAALDNHTHQAAINADMEVARRVGAQGTPGFMINGRLLMGAQPIDAFKQIIDDEITRAQALVRSGTPASRVYATLMRNARDTPAPAAPAAAPNAPAPNAPRPGQPNPATVYRVPVGNSPVKGPADALVTVVIFSDFQCPFCARVEPTLAQLATDYGRDIRFVWKNNPLPFHDRARPAAQLAMEAHAQGGRFWQAHDLLFQNSTALQDADLERYATQLGLNVARVRAAIQNNTHNAGIQADMDLAQQLGASGTPSFFINGRNLRGAQPIDAFKRLIDEELAKARQLVASGTPRNRVYERLMADAVARVEAAPAAAAEPGEDPNRVYQIPVPARAPSRGGRNARVVIQMFSDFQCPFCSRVEPTVDQLLTEYGDRIRLIWRNYPLPFHQNAMPAAQAAVEVYTQGGDAKFWQFHHLMFQNQQALARADLERYAEQIGGINMARFRAALDNNTHQAAVQADMNAVTTAGAQIGTPSFFINGRLLQGAQPIDAFKTAIDAALAGGGGAAAARPAAGH